MPIHIDRLFEAAIRKHAVELRLQKDKPPQIYVNGNFQPTSTHPLTIDDLRQLMRSITPDANQAELAQASQTSFTFAYGDIARFFVRITGGIDMPEIVVRPI